MAQEHEESIENRVYTIPELAQREGSTRQWLYQLIKSGKLETATDEELRAEGVDPAIIPPERRFVSEAGWRRYLERNGLETKS